SIDRCGERTANGAESRQRGVFQEPWFEDQLAIGGVNESPAKLVVLEVGVLAPYGQKMRGGDAVPPNANLVARQRGNVRGKDLIEHVHFPALQCQERPLRI